LQIGNFNAFGVQVMFQQLRAGNTYTTISWKFLFDVMQQYCARYTAASDQQVCPAAACLCQALHFEAR
jgi:hypothetical protein